MRLFSFELTAFSLLALIMFSCNGEKKITQPQKIKSELCVGKYYTEEEGAKKLQEYAQTYHTAAEWEKRADKIRKQIRKGAELNLIPQKDWHYPIKVIRGTKHKMDGYTVENIALELKPDYFVHGNLYTPENVNGKIPAILNPHGHWFKPDDYGRFRPDMQYRCAVFAKMGAIAFAWDMYGTGEDTAHRHHAPEVLTMQTFNTLRILDYISSLPEVDTSRIAITGASGGGTQTFIASAIDDRIDVSAPVVMVSAHFFGGCVCESGKPIHKHGNFETNNVEIAACFAPKPLLLVSDGNDWTKNVPNVEYPYIRNIYKLFGAEDNVEYAHFKNEVHNYGPSKRQAVYKFFIKHLGLKPGNLLTSDGKIDESFVKLLSTDELKVFPERELVKDPMKD